MRQRETAHESEPSSLSLVYRGHTRPVRAVAWSPDGRWLAYAGRDPEHRGVVRVWDARTGTDGFVYRGHTADVFSVAWSPDGELLASGGMDETVQIWDVRTPDPQRVYRSAQSWVEAVGWGRASDLVASACFQAVYLWDVRRQRPVRKLRGFVESVESVECVECLDWSPRAGYLAVGDDAGRVQVLDGVSGHVTRTIQAHAGYHARARMVPRRTPDRDEPLWRRFPRARHTVAGEHW